MTTCSQCGHAEHVGPCRHVTNPSGSIRGYCLCGTDFAAMREAFEQVERGELLSADESEAHLRELEKKP